jgi:hypothetical protein
MEDHWEAVIKRKAVLNQTASWTAVDRGLVVPGAELAGKKQKEQLAAACPWFVRGDTAYQTQGSCEGKMVVAVVESEEKILLQIVVLKFGPTAMVGRWILAVVAGLAKMKQVELGRHTEVVEGHRHCHCRRGKLKELHVECDLHPSRAGALEMAMFSSG